MHLKLEPEMTEDDEDGKGGTFFDSEGNKWDKGEVDSFRQLYYILEDMYKKLWPAKRPT